MQMRSRTSSLDPMEAKDMKRHGEISHPVQREEDSVPVTRIKDDIMVHLLFVGKHFSLKSHGHFTFVNHSL